MVRKYNPEVKTEYGRGMYDGDQYHDAVMKEEQHGKWVKLETFENVTRSQRGEIKRQQDHIRALQERIKELTEGSTMKTEPCPCCQQTAVFSGSNGAGDDTWFAQCELCGFEVGIIGVRPGSTDDQARRVALTAWNKRSLRMRKAEEKAAE